MTDYIPFSPTEISVDAPITVSVGVRLRDNPIAMFEGADGAPRLFLRALERLAAGNQVRLSASSFTGTFRYGFLQSGSVRLKATIQRVGTSSPGTWTLSRIRNGTRVTLGSWSPSASEAISVDIPLVAGDIVSLSGVGPGEGSGTISEITLGTAGQDLWPDLSSSYGVVGNRT